MSKDVQTASKRQRYINVFLLLGKDTDIDIVGQVIGRICQEYQCEHDIKKSFLSNFYYVKVSCTNALLEEVKDRVDVELSRYGDKISWMKSEVIEVR